MENKQLMFQATKKKEKGGVKNENLIKRRIAGDFREA